VGVVLIVPAFLLFARPGQPGRLRWPVRWRCVVDHAARRRGSAQFLPDRWRHAAAVAGRAHQRYPHVLQQDHTPWTAKNC